MKQMLTNIPNKGVLKRLALTSALLGVMIMVAFLAGYYAREVFSSEYFQFPLLRQTFSLIARNGLQPLPERKTLEYEMIRGLIAAYGDPYTTFVEPSQAELQNDQLEGKFGGIGIRIEQSGNGDVLVYPLPDSPAALAGLQDGDVLVQVESLLVSSQTSLEEIQAAIRGPIGSKVSMSVLRPPGLERKEYKVVREEVPIPSVTYHLASFDSTVGVVQLNLVADSSPDELTAAFADLRAKGATRFILDLRNNGGGLVAAGVNIVNLFLEEKTVFLYEEFKNEKAVDFASDGAGALMDAPLVIVVNQNTASASEIIAGALQKTQRALVVGNRTYGKDSVQLVYALKDGSSLHLTAGKWWIPGNEVGIAGNGLKLDVVISDEAANNAEALEAAAALLP